MLVNLHASKMFWASRLLVFLECDTTASRAAGPAARLGRPPFLGKPVSDTP
jgi:hypothetical protein